MQTCIWISKASVVEYVQHMHSKRPSGVWRNSMSSSVRTPVLLSSSSLGVKSMVKRSPEAVTGVVEAEREDLSLERSSPISIGHCMEVGMGNSMYSGLSTWWTSGCWGGAWSILVVAGWGRAMDWWEKGVPRCPITGEGEMLWVGMAGTWDGAWDGAWRRDNSRSQCCRWSCRSAAWTLFKGRWQCCLIRFISWMRWARRSPLTGAVEWPTAGG